MFCPSCGRSIAGDDRFCPYCGSSVDLDPPKTTMPTTTAPRPPEVERPAPSPPPEGGRGNRGLIVGLSVALVLAVAGGVVAYALGSSGDDEKVVAASTVDTAVTTTTDVETVPTEPEPELTTSTPTPAPTPSSSADDTSVAPVHHRHVATSDKAAIRRVVRAHWADIEKGSYDAAYRLLAPGSQSKGSWIAAHEADALTSASIALGRPTVSGSSATVPVLRLHTVADSGCFDWSGYYQMTKIGRSWRIGKAKISRSSC